MPVTGVLTKIGGSRCSPANAPDKPIYRQLCAVRAAWRAFSEGGSEDQIREATSRQSDRELCFSPMANRFEPIR
jgi:hypothetical protein